MKKGARIRLYQKYMNKIISCIKNKYSEWDKKLNDYYNPKGVLPQGSRCLIECEKVDVIKKEGETENTVQFITEVAIVKSVGEKVKKIKAGDKILFKSWSLDLVLIGKEEYPFIEENEIIAIVKQ